MLRIFMLLALASSLLVGCSVAQKPTGPVAFLSVVGVTGERIFLPGGSLWIGNAEMPNGDYQTWMASSPPTRITLLSRRATEQEAKSDLAAIRRVTERGMDSGAVSAVISSFNRFSKPPQALAAEQEAQIRKIVETYP